MELAVADTIGVAVPADVTRPGERRCATVVGDVRLRAHFHNTRNTGYANALAAYEAGVHVLDASLGGIGGCPFAPKATGNIATEDLVYALERSGHRHRVRPGRPDRGQRLARLAAGARQPCARVQGWTISGIPRAEVNGSP